MSQDFISIRSFRSETKPLAQNIEPSDPSNEGPFNVEQSESLASIEPIDGSTETVVLENLGIGDDPKMLPSEERENLKEIQDYVRDSLRKNGIGETRGAYKRMIDKLVGKLSIDPDTAPAVKLDKIAGVIKMWKATTFLKNNQDKMQLFQKLIKQKDQRSMRKLMLDEMEKSEVWA